MASHSRSTPIICTPPALPDDWDGVVLPVDKPLEWTSFGVVKHVRKLVGVRKVGHAGTLDPLATGLLIILVGRPATRKMEHFMTMPKEYVGTLRLGGVTDSYDAELPVTKTGHWQDVTNEDLEAIRHRFIGQISQRPPAYSAIKVDGERLYKKARRGEDVDVPERTVTVTAFDILERRGPDVTFRVACSKGTYIRSIAHDVGKAVGVGAYLTSLRRTRIGEFSVESAWRIEKLEQALERVKPDQTGA